MLVAGKRGNPENTGSLGAPEPRLLSLYPLAVLRD